MAGRAAEALLLDPGEWSLGAYGDIDTATALAMGRAHAGTLPGAPVMDLYLKPGSPRVADDLAAAVQHAIAVEREAADALLRDHVVALQAFASIAERFDQMSADEIRSAFLSIGLPPRAEDQAVMTKADREKTLWRSIHNDD